METEFRNKFSKHVYLLNKSVFSGESSFYGSEKLDFTQDANATRFNNKSAINESQFPTEKKDFKSNVNPHILKRNDQKGSCVWFGTYSHWISNYDMAKVISECKEDSTLPTESAAIHLKDFDVVFENRNGSGYPVLVKNSDSGVSLIKIYLVKKTQLDYLINLETKASFHEQDKTILEGEIASIESSQSIQDGLVNVGELDQLPIYIMINIKSFNSSKEVEVAPPSMELFRSIYFGLREAFASYSEQFILYYLYTLNPIKHHFSHSDLMKMICGSGFTETKENELEESKQSEDLLEETIKCSTCMPSDEAPNDTILEESKIIDTDPVIKEEQSFEKPPIEIQNNSNVTYSAILANTCEDGWDLFEMPEFNDDASGLK